MYCLLNCAKSFIRENGLNCYVAIGHSTIAHCYSDYKHILIVTPNLNILAFASTEEKNVSLLRSICPAN